MSNSSKAGSIDRRVPVTERQTVNALYKTYKEHGFNRANIAEATSIEREAFKSALKKLDIDDNIEIRSIVKQITGDSNSKTKGYHIHNFGENAALETLAKVGIFLNANMPAQ